MRPRPSGRPAAWAAFLVTAGLLHGAGLSVPASLHAQQPLPPPPEAPQTPPKGPPKVRVVVNGEARHRVILRIGPGGELRVPVDDLEQLGLKDLPLFTAFQGEDGRRYLSLERLFPRVQARLDAVNDILYLTVRRGPLPEPPRRRPGVRAFEPAVLSVTVNEAPMGDRIVFMDADGHILVDPDDLRGFGLDRVPPTAIRLVEQRPHVALDALGDWLTYLLDERAARLAITVDPKRLVPSVVDLGPRSPAGTGRIDSSGGFFNYAASYQAGEGGEFQALSMPLEAGLRTLRGFAFTDALYTRTPDTGAGARDRLVRQESHLTFDDEDRLTRLRWGDVVATGPPLGGVARMAGVSFAREFAISPHFIRFPGLDLTGTLQTPSEVEVYVNGVRIRRDLLPAGDFTYQDLPRTTGAGAAEVVIRDAFGRETRLDTPFYISPRLLKEGLSSFSYNLGMQRKSYGTRSFDYGGPVFSGTHRVGVGPRLNLGAGAELKDGLASGGPDALVLLGRAGELELAASASRAGGRGGGAWRGRYAYAGRTFGLTLGATGRTRDWATLSLSPDADKGELELDATASVSRRRFGSVSVSRTEAHYFEAHDLARTAVFYGRPLGPMTYLFVRASRTDQGVVEDEVFVGISRYLGDGRSAGAEFQAREETTVARATLRKNAPLGPGWGYRLEAAQTDDPDGTAEGTAADLSAEYHGPWGIYRADAMSGADTESYRLAAAGAVAWTGDTVRATRPVNDAFALVRVPGVKGVGVYHHGRLAARTDKDGVALVPDIVSYVDNRISIDTGDVPIGYDFGTGSRTVTVPYRGTGEVTFPVTVLRAYVGHLVVAGAGGRVPVELTWMTLGEGARGPRVPVGRGGEFYLENLPAGPHPAHVPWKDGECRFTIDLPEEGDVLVDLGEVVCEPR